MPVSNFARDSMDNRVADGFTGGLVTVFANFIKEQQDLNKDNVLAEKEHREKLAKSFSGLNTALDKTFSKFTSKLSGVMTNFLQSQEKMAYNLNGTYRSLTDVTTNLSRVLGGQGLVKQQDVYNNLSKLIQDGIVYNAEQRAYLETLSDDLGMVFNAQDGSLTRLINLQRTDLSANRFAIETSLKEFLNQNYETSQYIKEGFSTVSASLLEAQSVMTATNATQLEAVVQQWLGSLSSVGMDSGTISSLAQALGYLGSGNISALSNNNMQNLLVMGAARSGLSYADILTQGLSGDVANQLMQGIVSYIASMGSSSNNVVRSEYARTFGLNISDIVAASQVGNATGSGVINSNIYGALGNVGNYIYGSTQIQNILENAVYGMATSVASDSATYMAYTLADLLSNTAGDILVNSGTKLGGIAGTALNMAPLAIVLGSSILNGELGSSFINLFNTIGGNYGAGAIFDALASASGNQRISTTGAMGGFSRGAGASRSGSMAIGGDIGARTSATVGESTILTQAANEYSLNDIYSLMEAMSETISDFPATPWATTTKINTAANTVTFSNDLTYLQDMVTLSAMNIQNIFQLLSNSSLFGGTGRAEVINTSSQSWNSNIGWLI